MPRLNYVEGSIVVSDDGRDLWIHKSHTPDDKIRIEKADRWDLLTALLRAQGMGDTALVVRQLHDGDDRGRLP